MPEDVEFPEHPSRPASGAESPVSSQAESQLWLCPTLVPRSGQSRWPASPVGTRGGSGGGKPAGTEKKQTAPSRKQTRRSVEAFEPVGREPHRGSVSRSGIGLGGDTRRSRSREITYRAVGDFALRRPFPVRRGGATSIRSSAACLDLLAQSPYGVGPVDDASGLDVSPGFVEEPTEVVSSALLDLLWQECELFGSEILVDPLLE